MSEGPASPALPAAAIDISPYRDAVTSASRKFRIVPLGLAGFGVLTMLLVVLLVLAGTTTPVPVMNLIALGVAGTGLLLALFVIIPLQLVTRRRRELVRVLDYHRAQAVTGVQDRLAAIGYEVPPQIAARWIDADPEATLALVHDSVIAARQWQPSPSDERVFVEAYLIQGGTAASLPVLPPLPAPE